MNDVTKTEMLSALRSAELALADALGWVEGMHATASRLERKRQYAGALELVRDRADRLGLELCTCGARVERAAAGARGHDATTRPVHSTWCEARR